MFAKKNSKQTNMLSSSWNPPATFFREGKEKESWTLKFGRRIEGFRQPWRQARRRIGRPKPESKGGGRKKQNYCKSIEISAAGGRGCYGSPLFGQMVGCGGSKPVPRQRKKYKRKWSGIMNRTRKEAKEREIGSSSPTPPSVLLFFALQLGGCPSIHSSFPFSFLVPLPLIRSAKK